MGLLTSAALADGSSSLPVERNFLFSGGYREDGKGTQFGDGLWLTELL